MGVESHNISAEITVVEKKNATEKKPAWGFDVEYREEWTSSAPSSSCQSSGGTTSSSPCRNSA
jgi:hypothetical protein